MENNDIIALLYGIKENIRIIEDGVTREPLLDEVRFDFLQLIELIKLFLISERDSYYGYFLMNMQFRTNFTSNSIAGIKLNAFPPVFESNPLLLCKFTLKEIIYILCHEIDHVVLNHPSEMVKSNPEGNPDIFYQFNLAADAAVNDRINHEIVAEKHGYMSEPDGVITSQVLSKMFNIPNIRPMENYAYYFGLIKGKSREQDQNNMEISENGQQSIMQHQNEKDGIVSPDNHDGDKEEKENSQTKAENKDFSDTEDGGSNQIVTASNCGGNISDHNWGAGNDVEDVNAAVRELVNASFGMMNDESKGLMPSYFISQVEEINKLPVLAWQAIFKKYIGTVTANKRKTRMRLNRRQPERFDLSGNVDDKVLKIVVAIDTSASVNDRMINQIFNEIFEIVAKRKHEITVIECDAKVQRAYQVRTSADIKKKVTGRGGTLFSPVINYINKDKYFRDALLIYFTDGYGESEIPKPRTYRNMWVVIGDARHLSLIEPYGAVLTL